MIFRIHIPAIQLFALVVLIASLTVRATAVIKAFDADPFSFEQDRIVVAFRTGRRRTFKAIRKLSGTRQTFPVFQIISRLAFGTNFFGFARRTFFRTRVAFMLLSVETFFAGQGRAILFPAILQIFANVVTGASARSVRFEVITLFATGALHRRRFRRRQTRFAMRYFTRTRNANAVRKNLSGRT